MLFSERVKKGYGLFERKKILSFFYEKKIFLSKLRIVFKESFF